MALTQEPVRQGIRKTGPLTSLIAAATAVSCFPLGGTNRTAIIRKIMIQNRTVSTTVVTFGDTVGAQVIGDLGGFVVLAGFDREITEDEIPAWEAIADITAAATVAGAAPLDVRVTVECEVFMGT